MSGGDKRTRELQRATNAHYDAYPFDYLTASDEADIESVQPAPFRKFVEAVARPGLSVAEVGCGPGRGTMFLTKMKLDVTALDISAQSLALARKRAPDARFVRATNLALPFEADTFDIVVSDGVIHHTPDAHRSFLENVRILKPLGVMYLGVYNPSGYYYYIYTAIGVPVRWLGKFWFGRWLVYGLVFPFYYAIHLAKSRGRRSLRGVLNLFYDYIMTPVASFHSYKEVCGWAGNAGMTLMEYDPSLGNVHVFVFKKQAGTAHA